MKSLLPFFNKTNVVAKVNKFETKHSKGILTFSKPHKDVEIVRGIAFSKKKHFNELGGAMRAAKSHGFNVKNIADAIGCSESTVYKSMKRK